MVKKKGLGRGLSALMADVNEPETGNIEEPAARADTIVPIERIVPNPDQPRHQFDDEKLRDLANSIREKGVIQPLIVRKSPRAENEYQIVAGERRWRAAQLAQLHELPIIVRDFDDVEVLEIAIIENIQRADLNPVEEAAGYRQLMDRFDRTQEQMADALGKSRSHIANSLRLLSLPEPVLEFLKRGELSAGHARALITAEDPEGLARKVIAGGLSVRKTEALAKSQSTAKAKTSGGRRPKPEKDADTRALEGDLSAALKMAVTLNHEPGGERGVLSIKYETLDQLDDLCNLLSRQ